jgi:putative transposase
MPRRPRAFLLGNIFHVINRGAKRQRLFDGPNDYDAFLRVLCGSLRRGGVDLFAYCVMPNHWHLITAATNPANLSSFMHHMTTTHSRRWCVSHGVESEGAVYQGRFRAIPVQCDRHFLSVCRYIERNPLRSNLVIRAEDWPWSSLGSSRSDGHSPPLAPWPVDKPTSWSDQVNQPQTRAEEEAIRESIRLRRPLGDEEWRATMGGVAERRGRPPRRRPEIAPSPGAEK